MPPQKSFNVKSLKQRLTPRLQNLPKQVLNILMEYSLTGNNININFSRKTFLCGFQTDFGWLTKIFIRPKLPY